MAPNELVLYSGDEMSLWAGDLIVATMADESVRRIRYEENRVVFDERIDISERVCDIELLPSGEIVMGYDSGSIGVWGISSK